MHTNCDKKQYLFPQLGVGITQPHVTQRITRFVHSSHNHKQWTRQVSGSMMASFLRPFYWVTNRCTDVAPVLGRGTDLINNRTPIKTLHGVLYMCKKRRERLLYSSITQEQWLIVSKKLPCKKNALDNAYSRLSTNSQNFSLSFIKTFSRFSMPSKYTISCQNLLLDKSIVTNLATQL